MALLGVAGERAWVGAHWRGPGEESYERVEEVFKCCSAELRQEGVHRPVRLGFCC